MDKFLAYVLIQTTADKTVNVADTIAQIRGVKMVNVVTGPYDIIVLVEGNDPQKTGRIIMDELRVIPGIVDTLTCVVMS